jgi:hypothetical protein
MIKEIRQQKPFIHFGFNKQSIEVNINDIVTVWQDTIYVDNFYDISITSLGGIVLNLGRNKSQLKFDSSGTYYIEFNVSDRDKNFNNTSNKLTVIVSENITPLLTHGDEVITWGNNTLTFDN